MGSGECVCVCLSCCLPASLSMLHGPAITQFLAFFYWAHTLKGDHRPVLMRILFLKTVRLALAVPFLALFGTRGENGCAKRY